MRRLIALTVVALLGLTAVASAKTLISYERTGGFAGMPLSVTVGTGAKVRSISGVGGETQTSTLGKKAFKGLKRLIAKAGFDSLDESYAPKPGQVADGFTEVVRYRGKTVTTGTGGDAPARLTNLLSRLSSLAG
jgi:hypothetical protein